MDKQKQKVENWVNSRFDYIPLYAAELLADNMLVDHIDLSDYDGDDGELPYPMWGTLFHYRGRADDFAELAKKAGFLVIEGVPDLDGVLLGVQGVGRSFYEAHWLPLYRALFGHEDEPDLTRKHGF